MNLKSHIYTDETAARKHLERLQWPGGKPICPHCGVVDEATKLNGKSTRPGVYKCRGCEKPFSVTVGTLFERSHIPLNKWLLAVELLCTSKKGFSSHQLHRMLGVTYKTAWFMAHRIREAMTPVNPGPIGGHGKTVEGDETYIGRKQGTVSMGPDQKIAVLSLVERKGQARSFHIHKATKQTVHAVLDKHLDPQSRFMTDEAPHYQADVKALEHRAVNHSKGEYGRGDIYTNSVEGFFSIFKRGMRGIYQHCGEQHLQRYLNEFDFRYSNRAALGVNDNDRTEKALVGIKGKRLTYRRTGGAKEAQTLG